MKGNNNGKLTYMHILVVITCCLCQFGFGAVSNTFPLYFTDIINEFHANGNMAASISDLSLFLTASTIAMFITVGSVPKALEKFDVRIVITVGAVGTILPCIAMGLFTQIWMWTAAGFIAGLFMPFFVTIPLSVLIMNWFEKSQGILIALEAAFASIAGIIMAPFTQLLLSSVGWRRAGAIAFGIGLLLILPFSIFAVRLKPSDVGLTPYGRGFAAKQPGDSVKGVQTGVDAKAAFKNRSFIFLIVGIAAMAMIVSFSGTFKPHAASLGAAQTGALMVSAGALGGILGKFLFGFASDKVGIKKVVAATGAVSIIGFGILILGGGTAALLLGGAFLLGLTTALVSVGAPLVICASYGNKDYTKIYSKISRIPILAQAFTFWWVHELAELAGKRAEDGAIVSNYRISYIAGIVLSAIMIFCCIVGINEGIRMKRTAGEEKAYD